MKTTTTVKDVETVRTINGDTFKITLPQMYDRHGKKIFNEIIANIKNERTHDYYRIRHNWVPNTEIVNIKGILASQNQDLGKEIGVDDETLNMDIECDLLIPPKAEKKLERIATHCYYQGDIKDGNV